MIIWTKEWNKILRYNIWGDYELKRLMKIPAKANILQFTKRYFIRSGFANELLTDEVCRIVYSDTNAAETGVPNVKRNLITFDIYVKQEEESNADDDRLLRRIDLISDRLLKLLTKTRYMEDTGYRFWIAGEWDLGTRTVGYDRHTIGFYYMKVY